ncbi:glutamate-rich protein 6B [Pyxicephalus adspersus]|uniref:glutamate-rich protein 6B n=1 Tax=Pyxicephalus adspersus TaxID=30357 RepID=UPI003B5ACDBA
MDDKLGEHNQGHTPSTLTVENVTKLELQYESVDEEFLERRKVKEYIRKTQLFEQQQRNTLSPDTILQPEDFKNSRAEDLHIDGKEKGTHMYSETNKKSKDSVGTNGRKRMVNAAICQYKSVQTQTEWSLPTVSPAMSTGITEPEDQQETKSATSLLKSGAQYSEKSENTLESKSADLADGENSGSAEMSLNSEEFPTKQVREDLVSCDFCLKPKKPFPSVEQVISEPSGMLFCCVKSQELFQFMIMDIIKTYTPEETDGKNENPPEETQDNNEAQEKEFEEKPSNDSAPITPHSSDEIKALNSLKEELEKINTKDYITSLSNHLISHGALFVTEKITFSLESTTEGITRLQSADQNSSSYLIPNIDDYFDAVLDSKQTMMPMKTVSECNNSESGFLILFTDGTGQVLYPSGNIGILIARSKSTQFTFIVMEDAKYKPQIQAVFMSNGHAVCYHLNGRLWAVLDPCGGIYFDENGTRQKQWEWWDFSQHVHAPPFQPITLKLNANIEVKMLTQDRIFLTFTKNKEKVTFNVGSKLMLKDPNSFSQLKSKTGDTECYLCSKHLQISILLNNIRDFLGISHNSHSTAETMQEYVKQLQKSLDHITGLASKTSDSPKKQKKNRPHRTPSQKTACSATETRKGKRKGNGK